MSVKTRVGVPPATDGRNVDPDRGELSGEGSSQRTGPVLARAQVSHDRVAHALPSSFSEQRSPTYYDLPVLKESVWKSSIPLYFYVGGAAGALSVVGGTLVLLGKDRFPNLGRATRKLALLGDIVSSALLIEDLGRPSRFLNMLRVFRPSSPMSVGSFVLAGSGALNSLAFLLAERDGALGTVGKTAEVGSGALGLPLAGYTAVLLANTAVPTWQGMHRTLPFLFIASSAATAGAALELIDGLAPREQRLVRRFGTVGKLATLVAAQVVEAELKRSPKQAESLHRGLAGTLWNTAKVLTAASAVLSILPGRAPWKRNLSGALGTLGGLAMRFAVVQAGNVSARDPRATFEPQRQGFGAHEVTGQAAVTGPQGERALPDSFKLPVIR